MAAARAGRPGLGPVPPSARDDDLRPTPSAVAPAYYRSTEYMTGCLAQDRKRFRRNQKLHASGSSGHPRDEAGFFQGEHHLVDGWSGDLEIATRVGFGRGPLEDPAIGVDEGQVLALGCVKRGAAAAGLSSSD